MTKYHINKNGIPAPCKATQGKCPLGGTDGNENHFKTLKDAENYVKTKNENEYGMLPNIKEKTIEGYYIGMNYSLNESANENMRQTLTRNNIKKILNDGLKKGNIDFKYEADSFNNTPIKFDGSIDKIEENKYNVSGEIREYSYVERDFDSVEEYEEYLGEGPDTIYDINVDFSSENLLSSLDEMEQLRDWRNESQSAATILYGVFNIARNNMA